MKTLIIYAHPNHHSLCHAFLLASQSGLEQTQQEYRTIDLHQDQFDPVLIYNKEQRRRDMHKVPELEKYRQSILWADRIVMIYPIYWGRPPAMILGFIDRIFASHFAYEDNGKAFAKPLLVGKEAVCISTMKGPTFYPLVWLYNAHQVLMKKALFGFVGIKKVKFFEFGGVEKTDGRQVKMIQKIQDYFSKAH